MNERTLLGQTPSIMISSIMRSLSPPCVERHQAIRTPYKAVFGG